MREFERQFAQYVKAKYAIACANGTCTLHTALAAMGVNYNFRVVVPPLTMASTTLAVLHAGATPVFGDVDPRTWLLDRRDIQAIVGYVNMPVSLYGLWSGFSGVIEDAAQTLNPHANGHPGAKWEMERGYGQPRQAYFTSYSFQQSKIIPLGEGGMLTTNSEELADRARQFRDLGYPPDARENMKSPDAIRHTMIGYNYRMADAVAAEGLLRLTEADALLARRQYAATCYSQAIDGCPWITAQRRPDGWPHSYWSFAIAANNRERADRLQEAIVTLGGERCYRAWRITYQEPAFRHLASDGTCPVAEDLQPRILQLQTNHRDAAESEHAADCLHRALSCC